MLSENAREGGAWARLGLGRPAACRAASPPASSPGARPGRGPGTVTGPAVAARVARRRIHPSMIWNTPMTANQMPMKVASTVTEVTGVDTTMIPAMRLMTPNTTGHQRTRPA